MKKMLIILIILITTGCHYIELNDLSIIKSIGIDYTNEQYTIYAEIINKIDKDNLPETKILEVTDKEINKCFEKLILLSNKTIHYSHIDLLILSTNLESRNLDEIFNYFLKNKNFRNDFQTIASTNVKSLIENSDYDEIEQLLENKEHQKLIKIDIESVIKKYFDNNKFTLSMFIYDNDNIIYQNNITYPNERNNHEK